MIHRLIYTALSDGLSMFASDSTLYDRLFGDLLALQPSEVAAIKKRFAKRMPKIEHAYTPDAAELPCYTIALGGEQQASVVLGNQAGPFANAATLNQPVFSTIWRHSYSILCYAQQPDFVEYMYELAKAALYFRLEYFMNNNCMEVSMAGQDMSVEEKLPERLFVRALSFSCGREFRFATGPAPTATRGIDGVYVNDKNPEGKVGIRALVTPKA